MRIITLTNSKGLEKRFNVDLISVYEPVSPDEHKFDLTDKSINSHVYAGNYSHEVQETCEVIDSMVYPNER